eukprot:CAMPEP_0167749550 /NCGR_PEP_ID=MMETSP0110_2-20121227/5470_1 /TAXON_ID=629695 /ORGANISM="Gymnochlora sp., Strain CCMP2014" /LENGTH=282 /DNA_ID=CAMNT_0007634717 /DNA_START=108 /DNA_END=956 /DNA_ORIENTATION=-
MTQLEGWTILDSVYFGLMTATTVGYGDRVPTSNGAKVFVSFYALIGVAFAASALGVLFDAFMEYNEQATIAALRTLQRRGSQPFLDENAVDFLDGKISHDRKQDEEQVLPAQSVVEEVPSSEFQLDDVEADEDFDAANANLHKMMIRCVCTSNWIYVAGNVIIGMLIFQSIEKTSMADAFYWATITTLTVGYGDVVPKTEDGKIFAIFFMFSSLIIVTRAIGKFIQNRTARLEARRRHRIIKSLFREHVQKGIRKLTSGRLGGAESDPIPDEKKDGIINIDE